MKLQRLTINGKKYDLRNIVVIVGPNNTGKTKLLEDLYYELTNSYDRTVDSVMDYVYSSTQATLWPQMTDKDDFQYGVDEVTDWLDAHEPWKKAQDNNSGRLDHMMLRSKKNLLQWEQGQNTAMYQDELDDIRNNPLLKREWLVKFKKSHIHIARIDSRFTDATQIESVDTNNPDVPTTFYLRKRTLDILNTHMGKLFNKKFVAVQYSAVQYRIMLLDKSVTDYPRAAKSSSYEAVQEAIKKHSEYADKNDGARISLQSHGTRAAAGILTILADKHRKILFIDEPESHIYPAARRYIGTLIANESTTRQFFIVTHDVELLERLANSRKDFTVIKVSTNHDIKVVDYDISQRRIASSELKNTKAIRAGFNDATIFVEGVTDKYLYEAVLRRKKLVDDSTEYGLIDCDGNDRIADSVKFSLKIGTKVAIITDFDTVFNVKKNGSGTLERIIDSLGAPNALKAQVQQARDQLKGVDSKIKGLNAIGLTEPQKKIITDLLTKLKEVGVFIVPCGELFDWFSFPQKSVSVEELRNRYFNNSKKYQPLTDFLVEVSTYITS